MEPRKANTEQPTQRPPEAFGSVVSYPERCNLWGDPRFRGNCDGTLFLKLVKHYGATRVADPMMGSGTTRDAIEWLNRKRQKQVAYWGGDISNGFNLVREDLPGLFDLVWVHPPYWNMVQYGTDPDDLSSIGHYGVFVKKLMTCLQRCTKALRPGGHLAVLVADVRRSGTLYPLSREVQNMELGELASVIIKVQHNCRSDKRQYPRFQHPAIRHETCAVFIKR